MLDRPADLAAPTAVLLDASSSEEPRPYPTVAVVLIHTYMFEHP